MKKIVRKGVFETNSSSAHSISLAAEHLEFVLDTIYPDQSGRIYVEGGEYGWQWERYNDAVTKLSYAYQSGVDQGLLSEVVKEQTGALDVVFSGKDDGYVDHDSYGVANKACCSKKSTRNFIFNKNSWLFLGNDNSAPDPTFYKVPVYQSNRVLNPAFAYELIIEGLEKTTKFVTQPTEEEIRDGIHALTRNKLLSPVGDHFVDTGDVYFQMTRSRDYFEMPWYSGDVNIKDSCVVFIREGSWYPAEVKLEKAGKLKGLSYKQKSNKILTYLSKQKDMVHRVPFKLVEI